jgi:hypothetical protein
MPESVPESKTCPDDGLTKPAADVRRNGLTGLAFSCRECVCRQEEAAHRKRRERTGTTVRERTKVPDGHKRCPGYQRAKPLGEWGRNRRSRDGCNSYCKECRNARGARPKTHRLTPEDVGRPIFDQG